VIILGYVLLYVAVNMVFQRYFGFGQRDIIKILARDGGTLGVVSFVAFIAGQANLHEKYDVLLYISAYFFVMFSVCVFFIRKRKTQAT